MCEVEKVIDIDCRVVWRHVLAWMAVNGSVPSRSTTTYYSRISKNRIAIGVYTDVIIAIVAGGLNEEPINHSSQDSDGSHPVHPGQIGVFIVRHVVGISDTTQNLE